MPYALITCTHALHSTVYSVVLDYVVVFFFFVVIYTSSFCQTRMLRINSELVQEHTFSSRPFDWPFMKRGVAYWISNTSNVSKLYKYFHFSKEIERLFIKICLNSHFGSSSIRLYLIFNE